MAHVPQGPLFAFALGVSEEPPGDDQVCGLGGIPRLEQHLAARQAHRLDSSGNGIDQALFFRPGQLDGKGGGRPCDEIGNRALVRIVVVPHRAGKVAVGLSR